MFKSFYTKKVITNGKDTKIDKAFDKISDAFDLLGDTFENITECSDVPSSFQSTGDVTITNNNGHIVIEGKVKSLKVNGEDYIN